jgi:general stress protein 26
MQRSYEDQLAHFYQLVREFDYVMMTTVGHDGHLHSRPMYTQLPLNDSPLWFVTSLDTAKAQELMTDPRIGLSYFRKSDGAYVSVSGRAQIERSGDRLQALWKPEWQTWFPKGINDPDLAIIHVTPLEATYWLPDKEGFMSKTMAVLSGDNRTVNMPTTVQMPARDFS